MDSGALKGSSFGSSRRVLAEIAETGRIADETTKASFSQHALVSLQAALSRIYERQQRNNDDFYRANPAADMGFLSMGEPANEVAKEHGNITRDREALQAAQNDLRTLGSKLGLQMSEPKTQR